MPKTNIQPEVVAQIQILALEEVECSLESEAEDIVQVRVDGFVKTEESRLFKREALDREEKLRLERPLEYYFQKFHELWAKQWIESLDSLDPEDNYPFPNLEDNYPFPDPEEIPIEPRDYMNHADYKGDFIDFFGQEVWDNPPDGLVPIKDEEDFYLYLEGALESEAWEL